jgi:CheY-like chemotaxis protein
VEDSDDDAYYFKRRLQKLRNGCVVYHLSNGAEAIEYLKRTSTSDFEALPKIMFLDLKMPVLNGFEVLDWLQTQIFRARVRVIVLSGSEQQKDKERAAELGAEGYLVKPITAADLTRLLQDICPAVVEQGASS